MIFFYVCFSEVCVDEGQQLSLTHGCQFYEVSAAESAAGAALAFQGLLREARSVQLLRALPIRRKLGVHSVSRVLGTIFGKNNAKDRKKRPSLSIWRIICALLLGTAGQDDPVHRPDVIVLSSRVYANRWKLIMFPHIPLVVDRIYSIAKKYFSCHIFTNNHLWYCRKITLIKNVQYFLNLCFRKKNFFNIFLSFISKNFSSCECL